MDLLAEDRQQDRMVDVVKAPFDITLDEPDRHSPGDEDLAQCRVASAPRAKAVRLGGELRLVVCLQDGAHDLLQQFVRPSRDAERTEFTSFLRDVGPPDGGPSMALVPQPVDDRIDLPPRHPVHGLCRCAPGHRPRIAVDPTVGPQVEVRVVELSIDILQVETLLASLTNDGEDRFGVTHLAYLDFPPSDHLARFAMWPALPAADYYRASVALGLAPLGDLMFPRRRTNQRDLGCPLIPTPRNLSGYHTSRTCSSPE